MMTAEEYRAKVEARKERERVSVAERAERHRMERMVKAYRKFRSERLRPHMHELPESLPPTSRENVTINHSRYLRLVSRYSSQIDDEWSQIVKSGEWEKWLD